MKQVSILELKQQLSSLIDDAAKGKQVLITRHNVPVAILSGANARNATIGSRVGDPLPKPLYNNLTRGKYLQILKEDRDDS